MCIFFFFFLSSTSELFDLFSFLFFATIYPRRLERLYTVLLTVIIRNRSELSRDLLILARTPLSKSSSRTFVRRLSKERVEIKKHTGSGSGRVINEGIYRSISNTFATKLGTESFRTFPCWRFRETSAMSFATSSTMTRRVFSCETFSLESLRILEIFP